MPGARRSARLLALAAGAIAFTTLMGYALNRSGLYQWGGSVGMAINTAVALVCLATGLFLLSLRYD